jgi:hypothetical protein
MMCCLVYRPVLEIGLAFLVDGDDGGGGLPVKFLAIGCHAVELPGDVNQRPHGLLTIIATSERIDYRLDPSAEQ